MKCISFDNRDIGENHPVFIVAEIGINHNGDLDLGRRMIEAAAAAGADSVKFQNYTTDDFISDRTLMYKYMSQGREIEESQYDMFKRYELKPEQLAELKAHCDRCGVVFHSTPTSEKGVSLLLAMGSRLIKNGSDYLGHLPLIQCMARTGLPTVLSTGMATLAEVDDAVRAFRAAGGMDLILLHCTSSYPTPADQVHLRKMNTLAAAFDCPVGFSDHTDGCDAAIGAVARGACWIEKHFTLDRGLPGPDHRFSADAVEFKKLATSIRCMEKNLGSVVVGPTDAEATGRRDFRLSCIAARDLTCGTVLMQEDIVFCRPGTGLPPKDVACLIGQTLQHPVRKGEVLLPVLFAERNVK